jgi:hypothetical protein
MPKSCPKQAAVFELLIHASLTFLEDDYDKVADEAHKLAKTYKGKANGTTISPKLPSMIFQYEKAWKRTNEIKMAREEMKESFKEILGTLTCEKAKGYEASGTMMDDNDDLNITAETGIAGNGKATAPAMQIHVAPICGPRQMSYITTSTTMPSSQQSCACYYAPYCKKEAHECGGWKQGACNDFKANAFTIPKNFLEEKDERKKQEKRCREKERAARNKKRKQNTEVTDT